MISKPGRCAYCGILAKVTHTGRRWLCAECWREHLGVSQ